MSTATDERVDLGVDLDAEVPCCLRDCEAAAEWRLTLIPCRHSWVYCEDHINHQREAIEAWICAVTDVRHGDCLQSIVETRKSPL